MFTDYIEKKECSVYILSKYIEKKINIFKKKKK